MCYIYDGDLLVILLMFSKVVGVQAILGVRKQKRNTPEKGKLFLGYWERNQLIFSFFSFVSQAPEKPIQCLPCSFIKISP